MGRISNAKFKSNRFDVDELKRCCAGRWVDVIRSITGIDPAVLDGRNQPCPKCGGDDRFEAFDDIDQTGGTICRKCGTNADGLASIRWYLGCDFREACELVAKHVGIQTTRPQIEATYNYCDERGDLVFQVCRFEPKDFRQRKPKAGGGWDWKVKGTRILPYRLPQLLADPTATVFVVEGEKDCDRMGSLGFVATCNAGGAGKWFADHAEYLRGRSVVILPDNDDPGRSHGEQVARTLVGIASSIKVIELPNLPHKGDVSNWLDAGNTVDDLRKLVDLATEYKAQAKRTEFDIHFEGDDSESSGLELAAGRTDDANATRFVDRYAGELLHVPQWRRWLVWDGRRWVDDNGVGVDQRARRYANSLWSELGSLAANLKRDELGVIQTFARWTNSKSGIASFIELAQCDPRVVCTVELLNSNPLLLNVGNGTIDLATGKLRPHDPLDRITQLAPVQYDPAATCPKWLESMALIFDGDAELIRYVQQLLGYSISGDAGEHLLPIAYGSGANGKSTIWNAVAGLLGDYATLASESLLLGDSCGHPTERADLYQKRFVAISEPERAATLRESRVKELTGDAIVKARRMHENFWTFRRTHKFWLSTNHLPRIDGVDDGIWRRVKLIPFAVDLRQRVQPIAGFSDWLVEHEGPGIVAWLVRGFSDWKANGLIEPERVQLATRSYRSDSDALGEFIAEHCVVESGAVATAVDLFELYQANGGKWSKTAFGRAMAERFQKSKPTGGDYRRKTIYVGVRPRMESDADHPVNGAPKTSAIPQVAPVVTSQNIESLLFGNKCKRTKPLVTTGDNRPPTKLCARCESPMQAVAGDDPNWLDLECPGCGGVSGMRLNGVPA